MYSKKENKSRNKDLRIKKEWYVKREFKEWETVLAVYTSNKRIISRIYK